MTKTKTKRSAEDSTSPTKKQKVFATKSNETSTKGPEQKSAKLQKKPIDAKKTQSLQKATSPSSVSKKLKKSNPTKKSPDNVKQNNQPKAKAGDKSENVKEQSAEKKQQKQKTKVVQQTNKTGKAAAPKNGKFEKKNVNKSGKQGKAGAQQTEKPEDWNAFKKEKKELKLKRKKSKGSFDTIVKAKQIAEKLRMKKLEGGEKERRKLVEELHALLQGKYVKFVLAHDMARVVQYLLKYGPEDIRVKVGQEIIPATVPMMISPYGRFCVKRTLKYGNNAVRAACVRAMYGSAVKLASHAISAPVFEFACTDWASPADRVALAQEFYGDMYRQSKDDQVRHLRDVYRDAPLMKAAALSTTKANLARLLNKGLLDSSLAHTVIEQYLSECSADERVEMISQLAAHAVVISNSKDGARVVMRCIWNGTNKDRKVTMKAMKEHVLEMAQHEHGHSVLIALMDSADDTVLLQKTVLTDIVAGAQTLRVNDWGRKVLLWCVSPADPAHFHPQFVEQLTGGRATSNSKKDVTVRRTELRAHAMPVLQNAVAESPVEWLANSSIAVLTLAILKNGDGAHLEKALKSIAKVITNPKWQVQEGEEDALVDGIEHSGLHMTLKKLAKHDAIRSVKDEPTFGQAVVNHISDKTVQKWVQCNRGCYLLLTIYENSNVKQDVMELIEPHRQFLKEQKFPGAALLLNKTT